MGIVVAAIILIYLFIYLLLFLFSFKLYNNNHINKQPTINQTDHYSYP
jgi:amino acid transporter